MWVEGQGVFNPINTLASDLIAMVVRLITMFAIAQIVVKRSKLYFSFLIGLLKAISFELYFVGRNRLQVLSLTTGSQLAKVPRTPQGVTRATEYQ